MSQTAYIVVRPAQFERLDVPAKKGTKFSSSVLCANCKEPLVLIIGTTHATCQCGASYFLNRREP